MTFCLATASFRVIPSRHFSSPRPSSSSSSLRLSEHRRPASRNFPTIRQAFAAPLGSETVSRNRTARDDRTSRRIWTRTSERTGRREQYEAAIKTLEGRGSRFFEARDRSRYGRKERRELACFARPFSLELHRVPALVEPGKRSGSNAGKRRNGGIETSSGMEGGNAARRNHKLAFVIDGRGSGRSFAGRYLASISRRVIAVSRVTPKPLVTRFDVSSSAFVPPFFHRLSYFFFLNPFSRTTLPDHVSRYSIEIHRSDPITRTTLRVFPSEHLDSVPRVFERAISSLS